MNDASVLSDENMVKSLATGSGMPLYRLKGIRKVYEGSGESVTILRDITLDIHAGETVAIVGASGSGKSTLLHILGTLAVPGSGELLFSGRDMLALSPQQKARLRNEDIGFVFQFHHLLSEFSTVENVAMQAIIGGMPRERALREARDVLARVGLEHRANYDVTLLSGGERQRAAIARAILKKPRVLLADEPTGNLDERNGVQVADLLLTLNKTYGMAMVVVTHNAELAARMDRCFELKSGDLYDQTR